ncbi:ribonuclease h2 subunit c-like [Nannochloropsis oceanica]
MDNETVDQGSKCSGNSYRSGSRGPLPATEPVLVASIRAPTPNACVHALPCSIHHDGPAAINTYFMPRKAAVVIPEVKTLKESSQKSTDENRVDDQENQEGQGHLYEAQFRGRFLKGIRTSCPKGTVGFVVRESVLPPELAEKAPSAATNRYWSVESEFRHLTLWHHDFPPPLDHCSHQVEEWGKLARSIHEDTD